MDYSANEISPTISPTAEDRGAAPGTTGMSADATSVPYERVGMFPGWGAAPEFLSSVLSTYDCKRILELGSGANPTLSSEYVFRNGLHYVTSDINAEELEKADPAFVRMVLNLSAERIDSALDSSFDCVFSRMVNEHIQNGELYHRNIYRVLKPGGISVHCFSTLWAFPFAVNWLIPEFVADGLLRYFAPRDERKHGKFRAYYSWSRGPSKEMLRRFQKIGYEVLRYTGYFGHTYYAQRVPWLQKIEDSKAKLLVRHPSPLLCSYAVVILRRPVEDKP